MELHSFLLFSNFVKNSTARVALKTACRRNETTELEDKVSTLTQVIVKFVVSFLRHELFAGLFLT